MDEGLLSALGAGFQGMGAVASPAVAQRQAQERANALPNLIRSLQVTKAVRGLQADQAFQKEFAGINGASGFTNSSDLLTKLNSIAQKDPSVLDSEQFHSTLQMAGQMQQREALQQQRDQMMQYRYDQLQQQHDQAEQRSQDIRLAEKDRAAANLARLHIQEEMVKLRQSMAGDKYSPVTNIEVKGQDGTVNNVQAQQDKRTGQWVSADEKRSPIDVSGGFKVVKDTQMGSREATLLQRGIVSAADAVSDIQNVAALPVTANTGIFGMGHDVAGPGVLEAPKRALLNKITPQDAQSMQVAIKGIGRALAGLSTGGVYVNQAIVKQYDMLAPQPGDSYLTKLQKLATMRQNADNGIDAMLTNPRIGEEQKTMLKKLKDGLAQSIPYTPKQVIEYGRNGKDEETFEQYSQRVLGTGAPTGGASKAVPDSGVVNWGDLK